MGRPMHALDPLWNPRSPPDVAVDDGSDDEPELPDILVRLRKTRTRQPPHVQLPVPGPMTLRDTLLANCYVSTGGVVAREFQLDVGEAVQRNQDVIVQAFTGSGKTLAMLILLFTYPTKFLIMASPLNNLQESMCESFAKWGLISYAYNANVRTPAMLRELRAKRFDVLETAPESLVEPSALRPLLTDPNWTADCLAIAIDEGHCVIDWGLSGFRPAYARLSLIRSFMAHDVPFIVVSATLSPATMSALARILHFRAGFKTMNLGNIRPNIFWEVRTVDGGQKSSVHHLRFLIPALTTAEAIRGIPSTIVFVPSRSMTSRVANYLRDLLPKSLAYEAVLPLHAKSKPARISRVLQCFESGRTRILVATTIAGLGRDFRDVQRVIGYMPPENIEAWVQEAGRGARKDTARCWALLLVPKSVFTLRKVKTEPPVDATPDVSAVDVTNMPMDPVPNDVSAAAPNEPVSGDPEVLLSFQAAMDLVEPDVYVKKLSAPMRAFVAPCDSFGPGDLCRCQILAGYFDNPTTPTDLCDVCRARRAGNAAVLARMPPLIDDLTLPSGVSALAEDSRATQPKRRAPPSRVKDRLATALAKLHDWRLDEWLANWQDTGLVLDAVVPTTTLHAVAKCLKLYTLGDLRGVVPDHVYQQFGQKLLDIMLDIRAAEVQADADARARRSAEKTQKTAEREQKRRRSASPPRTRSAKRGRALADATNTGPQAGPSRQRSPAPPFAFPNFNLPSLAGRAAPSISHLPPLPTLSTFKPPSFPSKSLSMKAED